MTRKLICNQDYQMRGLKLIGEKNNIFYTSLSLNVYRSPLISTPSKYKSR